MSIELGDDGTMDTVLYCTECGEEFRFNYDGGGGFADDDTGEVKLTDEQAYDAFITSCIEEVEAEHECAKEHVFEPSGENPLYCEICGASETDHRL